MIFLLVFVYIWCSHYENRMFTEPATNKNQTEKVLKPAVYVHVDRTEKIQVGARLYFLYLALRQKVFKAAIFNLNA